jgi:hypothetical protein
VRRHAEARCQGPLARMHSTIPFRLLLLYGLVMLLRPQWLM